MEWAYLSEPVIVCCSRFVCPVAEHHQQLSVVEKEKKRDKILNIRYWYLVFYAY